VISYFWEIVLMNYRITYNPLWRVLFLSAIAALFLITLPACSDNSVQIQNAVTSYYVGDYKQAETIMAPLAQKADENYVLNNCRYGSCAIAAGDLPQAQKAFLTAYQLMNSSNVNSNTRAFATVVFYEGIKVWLGEPYERAMAHYYLGLTFLLQGDYDNARAAFENSLFSLRKYADPDDKSVPPDQQYAQIESNFALGYFGLGVCYLELGDKDLADANFQHAQQLDPSVTPLVQQMHQPDTNALIFVDFGFGPQRRAAGWYGEQTVYTPTPWQVGPIPPAYIWDNGKYLSLSAPGMVDTLALAQDKRWLTMDTVRETKAVVGTGLMAGGAGAAIYGANHNNNTVALAGLGALLAGALLASSSHADTRYWEMLPRTVYVIPAALPEGNNAIQVVAGQQSTTALNVKIPPGNKLNIYYFRLP
jgi:tetratricopeptide (TPR) repeat protein